MSSKQTYRIRNFEIDLETHWVLPQNRNSGENGVKLEPRIANLLELLILRSPEVVTREELIEEVWKNYGGAEDALNHAISQLRKVLHDGDKQNRIIETIPKRGYRIRQVKKLAPQSNWSRVLFIAIFFLLLVLGYFSYQYFHQQTVLAPPAPDGRAIEHSSDNHAAPQPED